MDMPSKISRTYIPLILLSVALVLVGMSIIGMDWSHRVRYDSHGIRARVSGEQATQARLVDLFSASLLLVGCGSIPLLIRRNDGNSPNYRLNIKVYKISLLAVTICSSGLLGLEVAFFSQPHPGFRSSPLLWNGWIELVGILAVSALCSFILVTTLFGTCYWIAWLQQSIEERQLRSSIAS